MKRRLGVLLIERGGLITLVVLALYLWLAPPHIVNGDNAEFATLGTIGGAPHPPGYPAFMMWLRLWSWLPLGSPAHNAAIATCVLTALQTLVLHAASRAWGARPTAAAIAVGLYAAGPIVLRVQSEAEVFAPHALICALILWLSATAGPLRGGWRVFVLGLVAGVGMSNQLTCTLLAPIGILGGVRGVREAKLAKPATVGLGVLGMLLGLSTYVYLLVTPDTWLSWGKIDSFHALWWHVLRMDYGGPGTFAPRGIDIPVVDNWVALARTAGASYLWVLAPAAVGALAYLTVKPSGESRAGWITFAASWLLCGPLLVSRFDVTLDITGIYIVQRFHLMSVLLLAVPLAVGLDQLVLLLERHRPNLRSALVPVVVPSLVFVAVAARSLPYIARTHSAAMERGCENVLLTLPPNAIVFGSSDVFHFGLNYLQGARYERRDVLLITTEQLKIPFYRDRIAKRTGIEIEGDPTKAVNIQLTEKMLATGRPVFVDQYQATTVQAFPTYPWGILYRVLPRGSVSPPLEWVYQLNVGLFDMFDLDYMQPGMQDEIATKFHGSYARAWFILMQSLRAAGKTAEADDAARRSYLLAPENDR